MKLTDLSIEELLALRQVRCEAFKRLANPTAHRGMIEFVEAAYASLIALDDALRIKREQDSDE